ncbi:MAG: CBS domain-containing protein [Myxococcaceae bacterium]|nr:MAG: CBS domain-containing protein [Myxococcaceae bacterium]
MKRKTDVGDWMTVKPITIEEDTSIMEAIHLLKEKNIRRLPVMRRGKIAGVVTEKMLLTFTPGKSTSLNAWEAHYLLSKTPVKEAMNPRPHTVTPTTPVREAAKLLHDRKLNGVLVTNEKGDLVGIFTITNALEALMASANANGG